jgi:2-dehydro-3-deoxygluconokinase
MLAIGECMMEIIEHSPELLKRSFAGDTFNALVYAKCYASKQLDCQYFTAVGVDAISDSMLSRFEDSGINQHAVLRTPDATVGIYAISTDSKGERRFSYWRNDSAAKQMMRLLPITQLVKKLGRYDLVFFSGISLGILSDSDKHLLMDTIRELRQQGALIAFDPNYRPAMWRNKEHAIEWIIAAYQQSDIVLPGIEEHQHLFDHQTPEEIVHFCDPKGEKEVIAKCAEAGTYVYVNGEMLGNCPFVPAPKQIDSTAAGDSFAGTYLASRLCANSIEAALFDACEVARCVVQHRGAMLPNDVYRQIPLEAAHSFTVDVV